MRYAIIEAGRVTNIIVASPEFAATIGAVEAGAGCVIGGTYANGTFGPAPAMPPVVPFEITMRQARLTLLGAGLLDDVQPAIENLPSPQKEAAQIEWEYSNALQRNNPFVNTLGPALGLTEQQIDQLFIQAATL